MIKEEMESAVRVLITEQIPHINLNDWKEIRRLNDRVLAIVDEYISSLYPPLIEKINFLKNQNLDLAKVLEKKRGH